MPSTTDLSANDILLAEFEYAKACAMQANEDRARVTSYFLAAAASTAAAILGVAFEGVLQAQAALGFAALFAVLVFVGFATLNQLAALRLAWLEACRNMNDVKRRYMAASGDALQRPFRWNDGNLPAAYKPTSVSARLAQVVAVIMGLAAASAIMFMQMAIGATPLNGNASLRGLVAVALAGGFVALAGWLAYATPLRAEDAKPRGREPADDRAPG